MRNGRNKTVIGKKRLYVIRGFILIFLFSAIAIWLHSPAPSTSIAAHRGGSAYAPENTIAALQNAIESGAEYAEVDVQQTRDGALILLHDSSFGRTAGIDKNVWDVDLSEVRTYRIHSLGTDPVEGIPARHFNEKIPTLEEALRTARGKIQLIIELKSTVHSQEPEKTTLELLERMHAEKSSILASMDPAILRRSKQQNPKVRTQAIIADSPTTLPNPDDVDIYSVKSTLITPSMLAEAHAQGKELFAWTVNDRLEMLRLIDIGIDTIVTDNAYLAKSVLEDTNQGLFAVND